MGIFGLTSFINQYSGSHSTTVHIRDCVVIIDGYNLVYYLYLHRKESNAHMVGGDYIGYAKIVRNFFQHLKNAEITPIVIFDGAHEEIKLNTLYVRFSQYIRNTIKKNSTKPSFGFTPVGMKYAFLEVLQEQNIHHFQTFFEADDTIALISAKLNAPVLSSDSDFQVYIQVPIAIPLSAIEFNRVTLKKNKKAMALTAKVVIFKQLCRNVFNFDCFSALGENLPLIGVLLGNDKIPKELFKDILPIGDTVTRVKSVLRWLQTNNSSPDEEDAMDCFGLLHTHLISSNNQYMELVSGTSVVVIKLIEAVIRSYEGKNGEEDLCDVIKQAGGFREGQTDIARKSNNVVVCTTTTQVQPNANGAPRPRGYNQRNNPTNNDAMDLISLLPPWFTKMHYNCQLPLEALEIYVNRRVWLTPQAELPSLRPSQELSVRILQVMAGVLCGDEVIELVTRSGRQTLQEFVKTITVLPKYGQLPTIFDRDFRNKGHALILETFGCSGFKDFIDLWPATCRFPILSLLYFLAARPKCFPIAIGVLLSILKSSIASNEDQPSKPANTKISSILKTQKMTKALKSIYNKVEVRNVLKNYDIKRVYHYSEYKCIFTHGKSLNILLGSSFKLPKIIQLDSFIVYHIFEVVEKQFFNDSRAFIESWFHDEPIGTVFSQFLKFCEVNLWKEEYIPNPLQCYPEVKEGEEDEDDDDSPDEDDDMSHMKILNEKFLELAI